MRPLTLHERLTSKSADRAWRRLALGLAFVNFMALAAWGLSCGWRGRSARARVKRESYQSLQGGKGILVSCLRVCI